MLHTCLFDMEFEDLTKKQQPKYRPNFTVSWNWAWIKWSDGDATDGPVNVIENLTNNLQTEFDETLEERSRKKLFISSLTKIFTILLSTRADSIDKIKNIIIKVAVKTVIKFWREQKWKLEESLVWRLFY